jgi:hypothetical protein
MRPMSKNLKVGETIYLFPKKMGTCFDDAALFFIKNDMVEMTDAKLVHGIGIANYPGQEGKRIAHAWIEVTNEHGLRIAIDVGAMVGQDASIYRANLKVERTVEYGCDNFVELWAEKGNAGPWDEEMRGLCGEFDYAANPTKPGTVTTGDLKVSGGDRTAPPYYGGSSGISAAHTPPVVQCEISVVDMVALSDKIYKAIESGWMTPKATGFECSTALMNVMEAIRPYLRTTEPDNENWKGLAEIRMESIRAMQKELDALRIPVSVSIDVEAAAISLCENGGNSPFHNSWIEKSQKTKEAYRESARAALKAAGVAYVD